MSQKIPMLRAARLLTYSRQTGRRVLTPRQRRRDRHKRAHADRALMRRTVREMYPEEKEEPDR